MRRDLPRRHVQRRLQRRAAGILCQSRCSPGSRNNLPPGPAPLSAKKLGTGFLRGRKIDMQQEMLQPPSTADTLLTAWAIGSIAAGALLVVLLLTLLLLKKR